MDDSRSGSAGLHELIEIMVIALCTVVRTREGSHSSAIPDARKRIAEP
jgi:hypothetical protein